MEVGISCSKTGGQDINLHSIQHSLKTMAQSLQDKIELEFKAQMLAAKEEMLYIQKQLTDNVKKDLKKASEVSDNLQKLETKFTGSQTH